MPAVRFVVGALALQLAGAQVECTQPTCEAESVIIANCNDFVGGDLDPVTGGREGTSFEGATCQPDGSIQWSGCDGTQQHKVTLVVTDIQGTVDEPQVVDDGSFMYLARTGAVQACNAANSCCLEMDAPNNGYDTTYECELDYAAQDSQLTMGIGFLHAQATSNAAACNPTKNFALVDDVHPGGLPNLETMTFNDDEGGYLAGVIAGSLAQTLVTKKVGVIGGLPVLPVARFIIGFINAVAEYCPDCEPVEVRTCFSFGNEPDGGFQAGMEPMWLNSARGYGCGVDAAMDLIANDVGIIFGAGGGTGTAGCLYAAAPFGWSGSVFGGPTLPAKSTFPAYVVGVDTDEYLTNYEGTEMSDKIITSAIKNVGVAVATAIGNYYVGTSSGANFYMTVANGGMGYAPCHEACLDAGGPVTPAMMGAAEQAELMLRADGSITGVDKFNAVCSTGNGQCAGDCMGTLPWGAPYDYTCSGSGGGSSSKKSSSTNWTLVIVIVVIAAVLLLVCGGFMVFMISKEKKGQPLFEKQIAEEEPATQMT